MRYNQLFCLYNDVLHGLNFKLQIGCWQKMLAICCKKYTQIKVNFMLLILKYFHYKAFDRERARET